MYAKDKDINMLASEGVPFSVRGYGLLDFYNERDQLIELTGEIHVGRNSGLQDIYVEVLNGENDLLMPIQTVHSIKWKKKIIERTAPVHH